MSRTVIQTMHGVAVTLCLVGIALAFGVGRAPGDAPRRARCSLDPRVAAVFVVPPPPFRARIVSVRRWKLPPFEPAGRGPLFKRLYLVTFFVVRGNAVLPRGHRYSQFAYVRRAKLGAPWCFLKGGSGP